MVLSVLMGAALGGALVSLTPQHTGWLAPLHLALLAGQSFWRQKNLALPMLTGRLEGRGPDLIAHNRVWLAVLLLLCVLAYLGWELVIAWR